MEWPRWLRIAKNGTGTGFKMHCSFCKDHAHSEKRNASTNNWIDEGVIPKRIKRQLDRHEESEVHQACLAKENKKGQKPLHQAVHRMNEQNREALKNIARSVVFNIKHTNSMLYGEDVLYLLDECSSNVGNRGHSRKTLFKMAGVFNDLVFKFWRNFLGSQSFVTGLYPHVGVGADKITMYKQQYEIVNVRVNYYGRPLTFCAGLPLISRDTEIILPGDTVETSRHGKAKRTDHNGEWKEEKTEAGANSCYFNIINMLNRVGAMCEVKSDTLKKTREWLGVDSDSSDSESAESAESSGELEDSPSISESDDLEQGSDESEQGSDEGSDESAEKSSPDSVSVELEKGGNRWEKFAKLQKSTITQLSRLAVKCISTAEKSEIRIQPDGLCCYRSVSVALRKGQRNRHVRKMQQKMQETHEFKKRMC